MAAYPGFADVIGDFIGTARPISHGGLPCVRGRHRRLHWHRPAHFTWRPTLRSRTSSATSLEPPGPFHMAAYPAFADVIGDFIGTARPISHGGLPCVRGRHRRLHWNRPAHFTRRPTLRSRTSSATSLAPPGPFHTAAYPGFADVIGDFIGTARPISYGGLPWVRGRHRRLHWHRPAHFIWRPTLGSRTSSATSLAPPGPFHMAAYPGFTDVIGDFIGTARPISNDALWPVRYIHSNFDDKAALSNQFFFTNFGKLRTMPLICLIKKLAQQRSGPMNQHDSAVGPTIDGDSHGG